VPPLIRGLSAERAAWGVAIVLTVLLVTVLAVPFVTRGEIPGPLEVLVAAGELLAIGFVLRRTSSRRAEDLGFYLLIVGLLGVILPVALISASILPLR
jgi:hypothetical protein